MNLEVSETDLVWKPRYLNIGLRGMLGSLKSPIFTIRFQNSREGHFMECDLPGYRGKSWTGTESELKEQAVHLLWAWLKSISGQT